MSELGMTFGALTLGLAAKMYYDGKYAGVEYVKSKVGALSTDSVIVT